MTRSAKNSQATSSAAGRPLPAQTSPFATKQDVKKRFEEMEVYLTGEIHVVDHLLQDLIQESQCSQRQLFYELNSRYEDKFNQLKADVDQLRASNEEMRRRDAAFRESLKQHTVRCVQLLQLCESGNVEQVKDPAAGNGDAGKATGECAESAATNSQAVCSTSLTTQPAEQPRTRPIAPIPTGGNIPGCTEKDRHRTAADPKAATVNDATEHDAAPAPKSTVAPKPDLKTASTTSAPAATTLPGATFPWPPVGANASAQADFLAIPPFQSFVGKDLDTWIAHMDRLWYGHKDQLYRAELLTALRTEARGTAAFWIAGADKEFLRQATWPDIKALMRNYFSSKKQDRVELEKLRNFLAESQGGKSDFLNSLSIADVTGPLPSVLKQPCQAAKNDAGDQKPSHRESWGYAFSRSALNGLFSRSVANAKSTTTDSPAATEKGNTDKGKQKTVEPPTAPAPAANGASAPSAPVEVQLTLYNSKNEPIASSVVELPGQTFAALNGTGLDRPSALATLSKKTPASRPLPPKPAGPAGLPAKPATPSKQAAPSSLPPKPSPAVQAKAVPSPTSSGIVFGTAVAANKPSQAPPAGRSPIQQKSSVTAPPPSSTSSAKPTLPPLQSDKGNNSPAKPPTIPKFEDLAGVVGTYTGEPKSFTAWARKVDSLYYANDDPDYRYALLGALPTTLSCAPLLWLTSCTDAEEFAHATWEDWKSVFSAFWGGTYDQSKGGGTVSPFVSRIRIAEAAAKKPVTL